MSVQQQLLEQPLSYELHLRLLEALREAGQVDELRKARGRMADLFPLTAELWLAWLDEERERVNGEDDQKRLLALYARACGDYLVPSLWAAYCQYAEDLYADDRADTARSVSLASFSAAKAPVRAVYSKAEVALHAHCVAAERVMRRYRAFEMQTLMRMLLIKHGREEAEDSAMADAADEDDDALDEVETEQEREDDAALTVQLDLVKDLYRRSLSSPVNGIEQVYAEYEHWVSQQQYEVESDITALYKQVTRSRRTLTSRALPMSRRPHALCAVRCVALRSP